MSRLLRIPFQGQAEISPSAWAALALQDTLVPTPPPLACWVLQEERTGPLTPKEQKGMSSFLRGWGLSE